MYPGVFFIPLLTFSACAASLSPHGPPTPKSLAVTARIKDIIIIKERDRMESIFCAAALHLHFVTFVNALERWRFTRNEDVTAKPVALYCQWLFFLLKGGKMWVCDKYGLPFKCIRALFLEKLMRCILFISFRWRAYRIVANGPVPPAWPLPDYITVYTGLTGTRSLSSDHTESQDVRLRCRRRQVAFLPKRLICLLRQVTLAFVQSAAYSFMKRFEKMLMVAPRKTTFLTVWISGSSNQVNGKTLSAAQKSKPFGTFKSSKM